MEAVNNAKTEQAAKVKAMNAEKDKNIKGNAPTYEQLQQAAEKLFQENQQLKQQLQGINVANLRCNYFFKTLEQSTFFSDEFVAYAVSEIQAILTPPAEENKNDLPEPPVATEPAAEPAAE